jgi:6-phosphogluconolactonase
MPDLGADKIWCYAFDPSKKEPLQRFTAGDVTLPPGSGPRHLAFHPNKKFVYCIEELSGMVSGYAYNKGIMTAIQRIPAHESTNAGPFGSGDIHISPDGKFLYASNRAKENNVAIIFDRSKKWNVNVCWSPCYIRRTSAKFYNRSNGSLHIGG